MRRFWWGAVIVGVVGWSSLGWACSAMLMDVREMVAQSDVVLLAEVTGSTPGSPDKSGLVTLRVLERLKGSFSAKTLTVEGRVNPELTAPGVQRSVPYMELDCSRAGGCGGCFARDYRDGAQHLLFLKRGELYWAPLAPANEEVSGPEDPWVLWVKNVLAAQREVGGLKATELVVSYTLPAIHHKGLKAVAVPLKERKVVLASPSYLYEVSYTADQREYDRYADVFERLVESFHVQ